MAQTNKSLFASFSSEKEALSSRLHVPASGLGSPRGLPRKIQRRKRRMKVGIIGAGFGQYAMAPVYKKLGLEVELVTPRDA